jgi:hypothetical protein
MKKWIAPILVAGALFAASRNAYSLTIIPTFDVSITGNASATQIEAGINAAIASFQTNIADNLTVKINFVDDPTVDLGESSTWGNNYSYASYIAALRGRAISANDIHSLGKLPNSTNDPVIGATQIYLNLTLARTLGLDTGYGPDGFDSTISLNIPTMNLTRPPTNPNDYDLQMTAEHEIDEVLGTSSDLPDTTIISPADLFRYTTNLARTYITTGDNAYFSVDGTNLWARYNMNSGGDYGDWWSFTGWWAPPGVTPHEQIQDAFAYPDVAINEGSNDLAVLDVVGYTLAMSPSIGIISSAKGQVKISWAANITTFSLQESTNLHTWAASATGTNNPAVIATGPTPKFYRLAMTSTPSVALPKIKLAQKSSPQLKTHVLLRH